MRFFTSLDKKMIVAIMKMVVFVKIKARLTWSCFVFKSSLFKH